MQDALMGCSAYIPTCAYATTADAAWISGCCNSRTWRDVRVESGMRTKADIRLCPSRGRGAGPENGGPGIFRRGAARSILELGKNIREGKARGEKTSHAHG